MTKIIFVTTHDGVSIRCAASLNRLAEITAMRAVAPITGAANSDDVWDAATDAIALVNKLIRAGAAFEDLRTFRHSPGVIGAVIEGADAVLQPIRESLRSHGMEVV